MDVLPHIISERIADLDDVVTGTLVEGGDMEVLLNEGGEIVASAGRGVLGSGGLEDVHVFFAEGVVDLESTGAELALLIVQIKVRYGVERVAKELGRSNNIDVRIIRRIQVLKQKLSVQILTLGGGIA